LEPRATLAEVALLRARWLRRAGRAAGAEARRGLALALELVARAPRSPEARVLAGHLAALAGQGAAARQHLEGAAAANPLVKGSRAWREAEAALAAVGGAEAPRAAGDATRRP